MLNDKIFVIYVPIYEFFLTQFYAGAWQRNSIPGVWLDYEISPMIVRYYEQQKSFSHFITNLCAIIGGVYAVAGVVDMIIYKSLKNYRRTQLGKD